MLGFGTGKAFTVTDAVLLQVVAGFVYATVYVVVDDKVTPVGLATVDVNPAGLDVQLIAGVTAGVPLRVTLSIAQYLPLFEPQ